MMPLACSDWDIDMKALVFGMPVGCLTDALHDGIDRDTGYRPGGDRRRDRVLDGLAGARCTRLSSSESGRSSTP
jgi:hypothetical protein